MAKLTTAKRKALPKSIVQMLKRMAGVAQNLQIAFVVMRTISVAVVDY
jgi:hypothetical protein